MQGASGGLAPARAHPPHAATPCHYMSCGPSPRLCSPPRRRLGWGGWVEWRGSCVAESLRGSRQIACHNDAWMRFPPGHPKCVRARGGFLDRSSDGHADGRPCGEAGCACSGSPLACASLLDCPRLEKLWGIIRRLPWRAACASHHPLGSLGGRDCIWKIKLVRASRCSGVSCSSPPCTSPGGAITPILISQPRSDATWLRSRLQVPERCEVRMSFLVSFTRCVLCE